MPKPVQYITSVHNPRVKQWAGLLERKGRTKQNKYMLEGVRLVAEALESEAPVETVLFGMDSGIPDQLIGYAENDRCEWVGVSDAVMKKCTELQTSQGVVAIVAKKTARLDEIITRPGALVVVLDGVQDPGNVGTIIRSADAVGATAVILGGGTVDLYNAKTIRATMGSMYHLPVIEADLLNLLSGMQQGNGNQTKIQVIATSLQSADSCYEIDFTRPTWLVFGNEGRGVSDEVAAFVNRSVRIPMPGRAESLNVAMAATVLLFEAARQRALNKT